METKMLLPIVPTMVTKVHDDEDFSDSNYYQFFCKQLQELQELQELQKLQERKKKQQQQQQQHQQQQLYQQLQLWFAPNEHSYEDNRNNNRNDHRNNVAQHQQRLQRNTTNAIEEKRTENQLQPQVQPKPEPKFEPEPEAEPQLNPEPEEEPTAIQVLEKYESKPVSVSELSKLDLQLGSLKEKPKPEFKLEDEPDLLLKWHQNLKPIKSLSSLRPEYSLYEENCLRKNEPFDLQDSDSETKDIPLPEEIIKFENQQFKAYCAARKIRFLKSQVFIHRRSPYVIMKPVFRKYSHRLIEILQASLRELYKNTQCNNQDKKDNNTPPPAPPLIITEADTCLYYLTDDEDDYITRCTKKAAKADKEATEEYLKELYLWKDLEKSDLFQTDFSEDEVTAVKEEQQVSFRHDQINVSEVMEHISLPMSPLLLEAPLSPRASYSSSEASPSPSEASTSSFEDFASSIKNPLNNEDVSQRITRRKYEEMQQRIAYNIKKSTLNDHCYHQTNVPETFPVLKELDSSTEESEDEEGDEAIIDVVSVKTVKKQVSFTKQVTNLEYLESQRNVKNVALDEDEPLEPLVHRRPRGRPPGSTKRKANRSGSAPKRARIQNNIKLDYQQSYQCQNLTRNQCGRRDSSEDTERRRLHNDMERQRRINMKESYEQLRRNVPAVACNDRASKVSILKQGTTYIKSLTEIGNTLKSNATYLKQQNEMLKRRLQQHLDIVGECSSFS